MLSDRLAECIDDLLESIVSYDYSDDFKPELIHIIRKINEVRDRLDKGDSTNLLKDNKQRSKKRAKHMYRNAQLKRDMSAVNFYSYDSS